jgi:hypothetical protein
LHRALLRSIFTQLRRGATNCRLSQFIIFASKCQWSNVRFSFPLSTWDRARRTMSKFPIESTLQSRRTALAAAKTFGRSYANIFSRTINVGTTCSESQYRANDPNSELFCGPPRGPQLLICSRRSGDFACKSPGCLDVGSYIEDTEETSMLVGAERRGVRHHWWLLTCLNTCCQPQFCNRSSLLVKFPTWQVRCNHICLWCD